MGLVEHYFKTKEQMLRFAFEAVSEHAAERIGARLVELPDPAQPAQALRAVLHEMLPLDQTRRAEAVVGFAFLARATVEPELAALLRAGYLQLRDFTADQIRRAQAAGQVADTVDPDTEAAVLLALLDGLTAHALIIQDPPEVTLASLENRLRQLFADP
jgi:AcrR family transcriptional regulator